MAKLTKESPICRCIVRSFLDFLDSVEPSPGVDEEGIEVARECLAEAFKLRSDSSDDQIKSVALIDLFNSLEANEQQDDKPDVAEREVTIEGPSSSSVRNNGDSCVSEAPKFPEEEFRGEPQSSEFSRDELFGQFCAALEKIHFFRNMSDGNEDPILVEKATRIFHDALNDMEKSGCRTFDVKNLAETLKCQGNRAMQFNLYSDAIELYSFAIALWENHAIFYCNRAAAYTQIHRYSEAISDCLKSIEIDPTYSKAYSRLGLAYYAQGNYADAIEKGFKRALQLDPNNESVKENIRVAEQKLREAQQRTGHSQSTSSGRNHGSHSQSTGGSRDQGSPASFSIPFNAAGLPANFASMFTNMANMFPGQQSHNNQREGGNANGPDEPEIRVDGNINLEFGDEMPQDISGALRSVMEMFGASTPQGNNTNPQADTQGRPTGN